MKKSMKIIIVAVLVIIAIAFSIYVTYPLHQARKEQLTLATTTSTYDSGLLDYLLPKFNVKYNCEVKVLSVGSGEAIAIGSRGDCDVLLVHSREAEDDFMNKSLGIFRACIMYNDFIVIGPVSDPAGINGMTNATVAFVKIAQAGEASPFSTKFVSRGDNSGTNVKENTIWNKTGINPKGAPWYIEAGTGMGDALRIANDKQAYTLVDRGTWIAMRNNLSLKMLVEKDKILLNPYGAIPVNPYKFPHVNFKLAYLFVKFLTSDEGQHAIADFKKNNEQLFTPLYGNCSAIVDCKTQFQEMYYYGGSLPPITRLSAVNFETSIMQLTWKHCKNYYESDFFESLH
jgi:tungstate transport system substrate-binding protein